MSVGGKTVVKVVLGLLAFYPSASYTNHNWAAITGGDFAKGYKCRCITGSIM